MSLYTLTKATNQALSGQPSCLETAAHGRRLITHFIKVPFLSYSGSCTVWWEKITLHKSLKKSVHFSEDITIFSVVVRMSMNQGQRLAGRAAKQ